VSPHDQRATRVVVIAFFTLFLDLAGFGIILPMLPLYVRSMHGTAETVGVLFACFSFTQLIATPILGRLSDRYGRRRVMLLSLAGNAASMVLFAVATQSRLLPLLFVSRIIAGATAGNISACQAAVADVTEGAERAKAMGRVNAGIGLGMVVGPALGSFAAALGPAGPPLAAAALAAIDLVAAFFLMPETLVVTRTLSAESPYRGPQASAPPPLLLRMRALAAEPRLRPIFLLYFLTFFYLTALQVNLALLANARLGWQEAETARMFTLFGVLGLVVQGGLIGPLTRAFGAQNLVIVGAVASTAGLLGISEAYSTWALLLGLTLLGIGFSLTNPLLSTIASERAGRSQQGVVLGLGQSAGGAARTVGPLIMGAVYTRVGATAAFQTGALAAFLALIVAAFVRARGEAHAAPVTES
jgi:MFS family permease